MFKYSPSTGAHAALLTLVLHIFPGTAVFSQIPWLCSFAGAQAQQNGPAGRGQPVFGGEKP